MNYVWKRDLFNSLSMNFLQRDKKKKLKKKKGLQDINFNKLSNKKPNFYSFLNFFPMNKRLVDFHSPEVFTIVSLPKNFTQKPSNFSL